VSKSWKPWADRDDKPPKGGNGKLAPQYTLKGIEESSGGKSNKTTSYATCYHDGSEEVFLLPNGASVAGGAGKDVRAKFATLVLDLAGQVTFGAERKIVNAGPPEFLKLNKYFPKPPRVVRIIWDDCQALEAPLKFWQDLVELIEPTDKVVVCCFGGHGRTGTALAAMMIATGWKPGDAVDLIRKDYCDKAVETKSQVDYLIALALEAGQVLTAAEKDIKVSKMSVVYTVPSGGYLPKGGNEQYHRYYGGGD
jgi:hypothetical protein